MQSERHKPARSSFETAVIVVKRRGGVIQQIWGQPGGILTCKPYDKPTILAGTSCDNSVSSLTASPLATW